jgi:hypothetical protein
MASKLIALRHGPTGVRCSAARDSRGGGVRAADSPVQLPLLVGCSSDGPDHVLDLGPVFPPGCEHRAFRSPCSLDEFDELIRR